MTDHVLDRAHLAEAVGNDIADMAHFWMLRKFQFLEPAREQFEIIVDPWLGYCTEPSQNEIMAYNMAFTDWLLFERPYRHGKTLLELYVIAFACLAQAARAGMRHAVFLALWHFGQGSCDWYGRAEGHTHRPSL